ncbi:MAG: 30S ribosomal protein S6 [Chitinophagales bacterium]
MQRDMQGQYETTFILTPVLSEDEAKKSINAYVEMLKSQGAEIIHQEHWGLKNLRYPIQKKTTGIYHLIEFKAPAKAIATLEIAYRRDESILRFLTVRLDKYAVKYNDDKRAGKVGRGKKVTSPKVAEEV